MKNRRLAERLRFALVGLRLVFRREKSFRTQVGLAVAASAAVLVLSPGLLWTATVVLAAALVLALELVNSAVEYLLDHLHPAMAAEIGAAKDAAAAAVLLVSLAALAVGALMAAATLAG